ncbi:CEP95 protein, partial [Neodrepanis coruscans]|nr:CEP95 protein [Neodrepanis coruscans]
DLIATPRSQEDDAHNVQAVIDSLALDYLQVSLSHITGENIVKGERESIRNLLEIFDGLLEYLTEASECSRTGGEQTDEKPKHSQCSKHSFKTLRANILWLYVPLRSQSECAVLTCDTDVSESTGELIRLGDTAHSFSKREEGWMDSVHATEPLKESLDASATKSGEPFQQAIPLLPPFQPSDPGWRDYHSSDRQAAAWAWSRAVKITTVRKKTSFDYFLIFFFSNQYCFHFKALQFTCRMGVVPLVHELPTSSSSLHEELSLNAEQVTQTPRPESRCLPGTTRQVHRSENSTTDSLEDLLFQGTTKDKLPEQELHEASRNLSRRLNELDLMLKRALGGQSREELIDEDNLSQHSDSVLDYGQRRAEPDTSYPRYPSRPRSLSPPSPQHQEDKLCGNGQIKTIRRQLQRERDEGARKTKMVTKAYEDELRIYEAKERLRLGKLREVMREMEQEYKENIFKEPPKISQAVKAYSRKTTPRNPKYSQWIPKRGTTKPKKAAPMTIRDNDLLLKLLEEFPYLHISHHTLNKMWQQQLAHTEHLKAASGRIRPKLQNEVQQALRKHELLTAIIKKNQDHSKRLQEFKQRIHRQKRAQNKVTEKKQQVARARKYYEDYRVQLQAKMLKARTREERVRTQGQCVLCSSASLGLLPSAQGLAPRKQMLQKSKRELRSKMEKEIQQLQAAIMQSDDTFFQELEADRLRSRLQMASYQYSQGPFF